MKKRALVLCDSDPNTDPRPNRMIEWLKEDFEVTVVSWAETSRSEVEYLSLHINAGMEEDRAFLRKFKNINRLLRGFIYIYRLVFARYEDIVWSKLGRASQLIRELQSKKIDLIVSHDCLMLPLAFSVKGKDTKVVLDAREYYPKNYDDQLRWRLLTKPINQYLCNQYLTKCDMLLTVSDGLALEYTKEYAVSPQVIMSLPMYRKLHPTPVQEDKIKIIYHGLAGASRKTEVMLEMIPFMDERFQLDLMLIPSNDPYYHKILSLAKTYHNINIIPPVPMNEIVPFINRYDIGLFLCPPTNFNLSYALPNKLFEFIQARLVVAIGPNHDMKNIVERYQCGIVSEDFNPQSLASELNRMTPELLMQYKQNSDQAASDLSSETNRQKIHKLFQDLLENNK